MHSIFIVQQLRRELFSVRYVAPLIATWRLPL